MSNINLIIKTFEAYSVKDLISKCTDLDLITFNKINCNKNWISAGKPEIETVAFRDFCEKQLEQKTKMIPGYGCFIPLTTYSRNKNKIKHKIFKLKRLNQKYKLTHLICELNEDVNNKNYSKNNIYTINKTVAETDTLKEAELVASELTDKFNKAYVIKKIKKPLLDTVAYSIPFISSTTKKGLFCVFGIKKI